MLSLLLLWTPSRDLVGSWSDCKWTTMTNGNSKRVDLAHAIQSSHRSYYKGHCHTEFTRNEHISIHIYTYYICIKIWKSESRDRFAIRIIARCSEREREGFFVSGFIDPSIVNVLWLLQPRGKRYTRRITGTRDTLACSPATWLDR